nr:TIGR02221 family CRISPR-associated protein [Armatimonas sp.]
MTILTTLGTGSYEPTNYVWGERAYQTSLFVTAVAAWFPGATVKAVSTELAWERQGGALLAAIPSVERVPIPDGANEDELWQIFNVLVEAIPAGETVIFDITHGFRSQPVLSLLVASFLRVAKGIRLEAVLYGAYERDRERSPVFDLTPFVAMLDWANATERFLETGDARKIASLIREQRKNPLNSVAARLTDLSEALALVRPILVTQKASDLMVRIEEARAEPWEAQHAPLKLLLDRIQTGFSPLAATEPLRAQWQQIGWLTTHQHYLAAAALAREWLVHVRVVVAGGTIVPIDNALRDAAESWLNNADNEKGSAPHEAPPEWKASVALWRNLTDLRNDLAHCGLRVSPRPPKAIRDSVTTLPSELAAAARLLGIEV